MAWYLVRHSVLFRFPWRLVLKYHLRHTVLSVVFLSCFTGALLMGGEVWREGSILDLLGSGLRLQ